MRLPALPSLAALLLALPVIAAVPAEAHAIVVAAEPAVDAVLAAGSVPVRLRFNSRIDDERSRLTLIRPDGSTLPLPIGASGSPDTLIAKIDGLAPGAYRLRWQVLAVDGHITRGDIPFTVAP